MRRRNCAFQTHKKRGTVESQACFKKWRKEVKNALKKLKRVHFTRIAKSFTSPATFWAAINRIRQGNTGLPATISNGTKIASTEQEKADLFGDYFSNCTLPVSGPMPTPITTFLPTSTLNLVFPSPQQISTAINNLRDDIACGPDDIPV
ncbi:unnamed protein product, partial [Didymodactylos carnosus]